ncbi:MAG TPA: sugar transferase [Jatrophihabitantaceae bacterium]|nr:sugar transferase [Jatrophihabitantaceae bacterium]
MAAMRCYEVRHLSVGAEEFKRVFRACAITAGLLGCACYVTRTDIARGYVAGVLPLGAALILLGRLVCRRAVHGRRAHGLWVHRIVAVGTVESVLRLLDVANRAPAAGLLIVGVCIDDLEVGSEIAPGVTVLGGAHDSAAVAGELEADVIALAGGGLNPSDVRELGWQLEGSGCGLVVAAGLTEVAGPRVHVSPVEGLPLMWLEQPKLTGLPRLLKRAVDLGGASLILLLTSPVFLATALAIKVTSPGPVYFRQSRLGMHESEFRVYKFRSMFRDAEAARVAYLAQNENDGSLFKMKADPRVTSVGRFIRKYSIDELPQLLNVLRGEMSLVGPRPLATADSDYTGHIRRRLLVQPGMTGLWQVSGRSDLSWDDAVRLDLYYVENWSFGLDVAIILRTINAVLRGSGAY